MSRPLLPLIALTFTLLSGGLARGQLGTPNPIETIKNAQDYRFLSSLFPQEGATFNPERDRVMSAAETADANDFMALQFDVQRSVFKKQSKSVLRALDKVGVRPSSPIEVGAVKVEVRDDQNAWSNAISPTLIALGARFLRGLVLGSLREAAGGEALFSKSLDSYLGSGPTTPISELETRARLFLAAARNGRPQIRVEADFREHFDTANALMRSYLQEKHEQATEALRNRLIAAAGGGDVTGADGMAMFDVFMRLSNHFDPALNFVLSHELGHIALGHTPYPSDLSCAEAQKREDAADAFAIALLAYDIPGETETSRRALEKVAGDVPSPRADPDEALGYGYAQAIRHGFALAGLSNEISENCRYREPSDRIAFIDRLRTEMIAERTEAIATFFRYYREHPPYVHSNAEVDSLTRKQRTELTRTLYKKCRSRGPAGNVALRKLDELPFGRALACPNRLPSNFGGPDFPERIGLQTWRELTDEYLRHYPSSSLMTEDVMRALVPYTSR